MEIMHRKPSLMCETVRLHCLEVANGKDTCRSMRRLKELKEVMWKRGKHVREPGPKFQG